MSLFPKAFSGLFRLSACALFGRKVAAPLALLGLAAVSVDANAATWTKVTSLAETYVGTMILMTDGTVLAQSYGDAKTWMKLTPDASGSYINGTWSLIAPELTARLYFASQVLPDGRLLVVGGEYSGASLAENDTNTGEIYNPVSNTWTAIAPYPRTYVGDEPSVLLAGGKVIVGCIDCAATYIYDPAANTWTLSGSKVYNDQSDEEGWAKLSDGSFITYDLFHSISPGGSYAERYTPTTGSWTSISPSDGTAAGSIPQLSSVALGYELGPLLRLQDGRIFAIGATQHTALFDPSTSPVPTWTPGPDIIGTVSGSPQVFGADDAPAAVLPNGHVIFAADSGPAAGKPFVKPTQIFDYNPSTNTIGPVSPALPDANLAAEGAYPMRMLMLPNGQVLFSDSSAQVWAYTGDGAAAPALKPVITGVTYTGSGVFTLAGTKLNGQSAGAAYGDDAQMDSNYPIVRLTSSTGKVFYAKSTNWSSVNVGDTSPQTVNFTLNPAITPGTYSVIVSGAGIQSAPQFVTITAAEIAGQ